MIFILKTRPAAHQRKEVLEILHYVAGPTSANLDCLACSVYEKPGDDPEVLYLEHWKTPAAAHRHIQSSVFTKILAVMDMSTVQPEIEFHEISQTWGVDLIKKLRCQKDQIAELKQGGAGR